MLFSDLSFFVLCFCAFKTTQDVTSRGSFFIKFLFVYTITYRYRRKSSFSFRNKSWRNCILDKAIVLCSATKQHTGQEYSTSQNKKS